MKIKHIIALSIALSGTFGAAEARTVYTGKDEMQVIRSLVGTWQAQTSIGVMTDVFIPFNNGNYVLGEELMNGKQITTTVFYLVNGELRADHYCDFGNQPRYTAKPTYDNATIDFEFRDVTDLDVNPVHFHSTTWHLADATHLTQDWYISGGLKGEKVIQMNFTKKS